MSSHEQERARSMLRWPLIRLLPAKTNLHFVGVARLMGFLSVVAVIGSLALCFTQGLTLGIDFKGGTVVDVATPGKPVDAAAVRSALNAMHLGDVAVQTFGTAGAVEIKFQTPSGADPAQTVTAVTQRLRTVLAPAQVQFSNTSVVGPKVSGELFRSGIVALGVAIFLMLLFIWFRYQLQFGLGAVAALFGLAIFGGDALRTFAIALIFGISIGTYSSIYVASPIILLWGVKSGDDDEPGLVGSAAQAAMAQKAAALKASRGQNG